MTAHPTDGPTPQGLDEDLRHPAPLDRDHEGWPYGEWPDFDQYPDAHPGWARLHGAVYRIDPTPPPAVADEIARDQDAEIAEAARAFRAVEVQTGETGGLAWWDALGRLRDVVDRAEGVA